MRLALEETLRTQEVMFEFQVQLRTAERTMPVEDASVEWPEGESPYRTVAHLLLPRQEIDCLRQQDAYKGLSFNVWHALAAHRPLGGINRVRRWAYALSSAWRCQCSGVKSGDPPRAGDVCWQGPSRRAPARAHGSRRRSPRTHPKSSEASCTLPLAEWAQTPQRRDSDEHTSAHWGLDSDLCGKSFLMRAGGSRPVTRCGSRARAARRRAVRRSASSNWEVSAAGGSQSCPRRQCPGPACGRDAIRRAAACTRLNIPMSRACLTGAAAWW